LVDKRFASIDVETGIRSIVANKNKDNWKKIGLYLSKYKYKWIELVKKYDDETVAN
jgi:hypothetical protein